VVAAVFVAACGEPVATPDASEDAGPDVGDDGGTFVPAAPALAALPVFETCPEGWAALADTPGCVPWALGDRPTCAAHEARFLGEPGCERIGTVCPVDGLPADAPATAIFVSASATGGDGTRDTPFGTITEALAVATTGEVVAVGVGIYDEAIDVSAGVTILGACTEGTVLASSEGRVDRGVITITGLDVVVQNLSIAESEQAGIWAVGDDRSVTVRDVSIEGVRVAGIDAEHGAEVTAERVAIRRSRSTVTGAFGRGATIENGARATFRDVLVEECREAGILAFGDGVEIELEDVVIANMQPLPDGVAGISLSTFMGGTITGTRVLMEEATDVALAMHLGEVRLSDSVIRGTRSRPTEMDRGRGANIEAGAHFFCERCVVSDNREFGLISDGDETVVDLRDVVVLRTSSSEGPGVFGRGVSVQDGAHIEAQRVLIEDSRESGLLVGGRRAATGNVTDLTVRRTRPTEAMGKGGRALTVQAASEATFERVTLLDSYDHGVILGNDALVHITDLLIDGVSPVDDYLQVGRGLMAQQGAEGVVERAIVRDVWDLGAGALHDGARLDLADFVVENVREHVCAGRICELAPGGHGLAAYFESNVVARSFVVRDADVCGAHVANDAAALLMNGEIRDNAIGACLQSDAQRVEDLQNDVRYIDNDIPLDTTTLPVPQATVIEE